MEVIVKIGEKASTYIGLYGPVILFIISLILLRNKKNLLTYYFFGFFVCSIINFILKGLFRQPRPKEDIHVPNIILTYGKRFGYDIYGMPSGHMQFAFYSIAFIYFALRKSKESTYVLLGMLLIGMITCVQRFVYKNHTMMQLLVGSLVGIIIGYICFTFATKHISKKSMTF